MEILFCQFKRQKANFKSVYGLRLNQYNRHSTLMSAYKNIDDIKFRHYILKQKSDVFQAMKSFFRKDEENKLYV